MGQVVCGARVLVGEGRPSSPRPLSSPVTCAHKVFPVSGLPEHPSPLCGRRHLGALGPCLPEAPRWAGLGPWGADASEGESRPPVLLLVSSECCTHQGPGGGWPDTALLAQPPRGWVGGHLLPGALAADSNKAVPQTLPGSLACVQAGPWAGDCCSPRGSPRALGRQEARPPELELDPVVWVTCGQGTGLGRPGRESLAFPGALGQGRGQVPQRAGVCLSSCVLKSWQKQGPLGGGVILHSARIGCTHIQTYVNTHKHIHTCTHVRTCQGHHAGGPSVSTSTVPAPSSETPLPVCTPRGVTQCPVQPLFPPGVGVGLGQEHQQPPCRLHGSRGHSVTRGPGGDLGIFDASVFWGVPGWLRGPRVGLALPAGRGEGPRPLRWPPRLAHGCGQLTPTAGLAAWAFKRSVQAGS